MNIKSQEEREAPAKERLYQQLLTFERGDIFSLNYELDGKRHTDVFIFCAVRKLTQTMFTRIECDVIYVTIPRWEYSKTSGKVENMGIVGDDIVEKI